MKRPHHLVAALALLALPLGAGAASGRAIAHYLRARMALSQSDVGTAVRELRLALPHDPDSPALHAALAEALARSGDLAGAEREARAALSLGPSGSTAVDAHVLLGRLLAERGRRADAAAELERGAAAELALVRARRGEARPVDADPFRALASHRAQGGDDAGALAAWEGLGALQPRAAAAGLRELAASVAGARPSLAERAARRSTELAPSDVEGWKLVGSLAEAAKRDADARAAWDRAAAVEPDDAEAHLGVGRLALKRGDVGPARAAFAEVLAVDADEAAARVRIAAAWLEAKRPEEALEVAGDRDEPRLLYVRGLALEAQGRWAEAADLFARVKPSSGEIYASARASEARALGRAGRHAEAVARLRAALAERPRDEVLLYALGSALERAGDVPGAVAQMRALLAVNPEHAEAMNFVGYLFADRGERLDEAQALVERALAIEPGNGAFVDSLGWVLFKKGDAGGAVKALERAEELTGPDPTVLEHLGDAYRALGRTPEAAAAYRRALRGGAEDADADAGFEPGQRAGLERKLREVGVREARPAPPRPRR